MAAVSTSACSSADPGPSAELRPRLDFTPVGVPLKFTFYPLDMQLTVSIDKRVATPLGVFGFAAVASPVHPVGDNRLLIVRANGLESRLEVATGGDDLIVDAACPTSTRQSSDTTTIELLDDGSSPCRFIAYRASGAEGDPLAVGRYSRGRCFGYLVLVGSVNDNVDDTRAQVRELLERHPDSSYRWNGDCAALDHGRYSVAYWFDNPSDACDMWSRVTEVAFETDPSLPPALQPAVRRVDADEWTQAVCGT